MFTGIIEETGRIAAVTAGRDAARVTVEGPRVTADAALGDSIAVSGVCLTVVSVEDGAFTADVMAATLTATTIGAAGVGSAVNLERATRADGRLGGHIVQGHVDATATLLSRTEGSAWRVLRFSLDAEHAGLVASRGSVAVDGVSLTVSAVSDAGEPDGWFEVSLIPETLEATTLGERVVGDAVNVETDVLARQVARLAAVRAAEAAS